MKHLIDPMDLSVEEIEELLSLAMEIMREPLRFSNVCNGKKLAVLFYEPSTRTRLSFEAAMLELGGNVLGFSSADTSSASKGESIADTIRIVSCYADICCIRHPKEGSAYVAAKYSGIPVINAGDGGHQHPTQTLTDLLTINIVKGTLGGMTIGMCGDLMFGRTVHSLVKAMSRYKDNRFVLISPPELVLPPFVKDKYLTMKSVEYCEVKGLEESISELDILYMTRVQRERFFNEEEYIRLKDSYILDMKKLESAKKDLAVLHPLPRVNEIAPEIDDDPRAYYFKQAGYGKYIRMALIMKMLGLDGGVR